MLRVIREVQPAWVVGENVTGIIKLALDDVLASLESEEYAVQTFIIPACAQNAPHRRDRVWIIAQNSNLTVNGRQEARGQQSEYRDIGAAVQVWPNTNTKKIGLQGGIQTNSSERQECNDEQPNGCDRKRTNSSNSNATYSHQIRTDTSSPKSRDEGQQSTNQKQLGNGWTGKDSGHFGKSGQWERCWYEVATQFCRVDAGVSEELDELRNADRTKRLGALGNAIVPQIAYEIFKAIELTPTQTAK